MEEVMARAWKTLTQIIKENTKETYSKDEILSLLARTLKREADNIFVEQLERSIGGN